MSKNSLKFTNDFYKTSRKIIYKQFGKGFFLLLFTKITTLYRSCQENLKNHHIAIKINIYKIDCF